MHAPISVTAARDRRICRICGLPIGQQRPDCRFEPEDYLPVRQWEGISTRNGDEYAHTACVTANPFSAN